MSHSVWHRLVRPNNSQAQNTDPSKVIAMSTWDVDDLKTAVWNKNPNSLRNIDASDLKVYKNQASLAANESLKPWVRVTGLGQSYEDPVIIVVPLPSRLLSAHDQPKVLGASQGSGPMDIDQSSSVDWSLDDLADVTVLATCNDFLSRMAFSDAVTECRQGTLQLELHLFGKNWLPKANGRASLLLSKLDVCIDPKTTSEVKRKLELSTCAVLYGTSGSGKTRTILEILAEEAGFYFSSCQDGKTRLGSMDMQVMFEKLKETLVPEKFNENEIYACRYYYCLLASRFCVAHYIWPEFKNIKAYQWLLLQLEPELFCGVDIFNEIALQFRYMASKKLTEYILQKLNQWQQATGSTLPVVLDEAQLLLSNQWNHFCSSDGSSRPLYTAIVRSHESLQIDVGNFPLVVISTGLSLNEARVAASSSVAKDSFHEYVISNGYDTPESSKQYIDQYVGNFPLALSALFVGRCRFAARLVEELLLEKKGAVEADTILHFEKQVNDMRGLFCNIRSKYQELTNEIDEVMLYLDDALINYLLGKGPIVVEKNLKALFESGIGRLKTIDQHRIVEIAEPIVIAGFMKSAAARDLEGCIHRRLAALGCNPTQLGFEFELFVAYQFLLYFKTPVEVDTCYFLCADIRKKFSGKRVKIHVPFPHHPKFSEVLTPSKKTVGQFLSGGHAPFGFPDIHTGPDIVFILTILNQDLSYHNSILMLVQCKLTMSKVDMDTGLLRTTTLDCMYTAKNGMRYTTREAEFKELQQIMTNLNITTVGGAAVIFPYEYAQSELKSMREAGEKECVVLFAADENGEFIPPLFSISDIEFLSILKEVK